MSNILEIISAGGDLATLAIFYVMWRIDRRVVKIETHIEVKS